MRLKEFWVPKTELKENKAVPLTMTSVRKAFSSIISFAKNQSNLSQSPQNQWHLIWQKDRHVEQMDRQWIPQRIPCKYTQVMFQNGAKDIVWEKPHSFQEIFLKNTGDTDAM
jgi:hypothetical protein